MVGWTRAWVCRGILWAALLVGLGCGDDGEVTEDGGPAQDAQVADAGAVDGGVGGADASMDAGAADGGVGDAGGADVDAAAVDGGVADAGPGDAGLDDASTVDDASSTDAFVPDAGIGCVVPLDFSTISAAIGDDTCPVVTVMAGTYMENLVIDRSVEIVGVGTVVVDGGGVGRVVVIPTQPLEIRLANITLRNGIADRGAGIFNGATLTLDGVVVRDNEARQVGPTRSSGGGIQNLDTLTLRGSTIEANRVTSAMNSPLLRGAGIYSDGGTVIVEAGSAIRGNVIAVAGYIGSAQAFGAGMYLSGAVATVTDSVIEMNAIALDAETVGLSALARGAGVAAGGSSSRIELLSGARVSANSVEAHVGGVGRNASALGAGIHLALGTLVTNGAEVTLNEARAEGAAGNLEAGGGGIFNHLGGTLTITDTSIAGNVASTGATTSTIDAAFGGGLALVAGSGTSVELTRTTIASNEVDGGRQSTGGGLHATTGGPDVALALRQSTISSNRVLRGETTAGGGGLYLTAAGTLADHEVDVHSSTIAMNEVVHASGGGGGLVADGFPLRLAGSLLFGNTAATGGQCAGTVDSVGYSLFESQAGCTVTGAQTGDVAGDPSLGPLADNGGPTQSHAIGPSGAAHEAGDPAGCADHLGTAFTTDQRGQPRPVGRCDIGAFELEP